MSDNQLSAIPEMERRLAQASDPKETFALEAASKAAMAWAKEQQDYEMLVNAGRIYLLSKRKTTELIEPEILHGGHGANQYKSRDTLEGYSAPTIADYGFTKKQWQIRKKLIEINDDQIDDYIDYCIETLGEPTTGGLIRYLVDQEREAINDLQEPDDTDYTDELINKWGVEYGQVWTIGNHRLMCGDATSRDDVNRLLVGEIPAIMINDPPYGMRLDADFSDMKSKLTQINVAGGGKYDQVEGDWEDYDASTLRLAFEKVKEQFWFGADYYSQTLGDTMHDGAWLVWDKRLDESADKMYGSCFELIWSAKPHKRDILRYKWAGIFGMDTNKRMHPNQKPVSLYSDLLYRYSKPGDTMLDCYVGSGTSLVACQHMSRIGRGIELLPKFVAVTLERLNVAYPELEISNEQ